MDSSNINLRQIKSRERSRQRSGSRGFTLIEISIALALMVAISMAGFEMSTVYRNFQNANTAGSVLKLVRQAQLAYLADNPTKSYSDLSDVDPTFLSYFTDNVFPTLPTFPDGTQAYINFNTFPPFASKSPGGTLYDPTSSTIDGMWDSGP